MTTNIELLQAALASLQPAPNGYPAINYTVLNPAPLGSHLGGTFSASSNVVTTVSPPPRALTTLDVNQVTANGYASTQWAGGRPPAPILPLGCLQQQNVFPRQPMMTPTTRDYSAINAPLSPFPTPPATPASGSVYPTSHTRFPFSPAAIGYNLALTTVPQAPLQTNSAALPNYFLPLPPVLPGTLAETPSPTPSPNSLLQQPPVSAISHLYSDTVSHCLFLSYLDKIWPESPLRRSSSIIRSTLYDKIVSVLQGGEAKGRQRQWIKKFEFFLVEKEGRGQLLAVPVVKSRVSKRGASEGDGGGKSEPKRVSYRLVARLEDFYYIISSYHNNTVGHHGIRKTFGLIQEEYSYLPRTAVTKYIELCNICRVHRTGKQESSGRRSKAAASNKKTSSDAENSVSISNTLPEHS